MDKNELVVIKENCPVLSEKVESYLDEVYDLADAANAQVEDARHQLLQVMIENNIFSCKVGKYSISQVNGKETVIFDTEKFLLEASEDIVNAFSEIKKSEPEFDLERFKLEHPEMYAAYLKYDESVEVDTKRLEKTLPAVFEKYVSRVKSDKKPTIMIKVAKEKKK